MFDSFQHVQTVVVFLHRSSQWWSMFYQTRLHRRFQCTKYYSVSKLHSISKFGSNPGVVSRLCVFAWRFSRSVLHTSQICCKWEHSSLRVSGTLFRGYRLVFSASRGRILAVVTKPSCENVRIETVDYLKKNLAKFREHINTIA